MGHGKETPRQKMIGMMYLVLLALLAMNVSAEILNAFILVDNSLNTSSKNLDSKNDGIRQEFIKAYELNKVAVQEWKDKADETSTLAKNLVEEVNKLQKEIVLEADGTSVEYEKDGCVGVSKKDDKESGTRLMIELKKGKELKEKVATFRERMIELAGGDKESPLVKAIMSSLNTDDIISQDGSKISWEHANFSELPLVATITMLSKLKTDIKNTEGDLLTYLKGKIGAQDFKFNKIEAFVNAKTSSVLVGEEYKAQVFIAASDSTQEPVIVMNSGEKLKIEDGKGVFVGNTSTPGIKTWGGIIKMYSPATGDTVPYKFETQYQVSPPSMSVSANKMNVFYIGVDNPVTISASGVASTDIVASISSGNITKTNSGFVVRVNKVGPVKVDVRANNKLLGSTEFRCKQVPDPVAELAIGSSKRGGLISKEVLKNNYITAKIERFDFELEFQIISFNLAGKFGIFDEEAASSSAKMTSEQKRLIDQAKPGTKVYLENIKAKGPDGLIRDLGTLGFKIQ